MVSTKHIGYALYSHRCLRRIGMQTVVDHVRKRNPRILTFAHLQMIEEQRVMPTARIVSYLAHAYGIKKDDIFHTAEEMAASKSSN